MSDAVKKAIVDMQAILAGKLEEIATLKRTINGMAAAVGDPPVYDVLEEEAAAARRPAAEVRPDEFFGRSPITAAREFLERSGSHEPKTVEEILDALTRGGFDFQAQSWKPEHRLRNLSISLGKNTQIFVRLPSGPFGLVKWYPELKQKKNRSEAGTRSAPTSRAASAEAVVADGAEESEDEQVEAEEAHDGPGE